MCIVDDEKYSKPLEWEYKALAMPNIPRGKGYPTSLKTILTTLKEQKNYNSIVNIEGSERKETLNEMCVRLRPINIVNGSPKTEWKISYDIFEWLEKNDDLFLASILNANIKFFSEILNILAKEKCKVQNILKIAINDYKIPWKTKQEVITRLNWLKDLNLVQYEDFSYKYQITALGQEFLNDVGFFDFKSIKEAIDQTVDESEVQISDWAFELCKINVDVERKSGIGYYPGSVKTLHLTIMEYLNLMTKSTDIQNIIRYSTEKYSISENTSRMFITSLKNLKFIEQVSKTHFQKTEFSEKLSDENLEIDYACCIHHKFKFVFEILAEIGERKLRIKEIQEIGRVSYNLLYSDSAEIYKRIHILKNANLIQETGPDSYGLTNRGKTFYEMIKEFLPLNNNKNEQVSFSIIENEIPSSLNEILYEIKDASQDSTNPNRFEEALKIGFSFLGFKAERIGGSGKTDILLHAPTAPKFTYSIAADAKSTHYNEVPESSIDFITINEHKRKHKTDFASIIGINFGEKSRLIKRAVELNILLIDIYSLEEMIRWHAEIPLNAESYRKIFNQVGLINIKVLEEDRKKIKREGNLMQAILECLSEQSSDLHTKGIVTAREIYIILKNDERFDSSPSVDEVKLMLELLSSPLIGCVGKAKDEFYALGSSMDAAQKFHFYFKACAEDKKI